MKNFESFGLSPILGQSLDKMKYTEPTPIQAQAIPLALKGRDIMGSAQTGTGKTAAFAIPIIQRLLTSKEDSALVLTPTRELGKQIMDIMHQLLGHKSEIDTAFIIGGQPIGKQFAQLRRNPRLVVGTPGRLNDHLERGTLKLDKTTFLVLDETDRMLDMGFSVQIDRIVKHLPKERQTLMFSATLPDDIIKLSNKYLHKPERIAVGSTINPVENITQEIIRVDNEKKYDVLTSELQAREGSIIIFVKTRRNTERLAKKLSAEHFEAEAIHGDLRQSKRDRVIRDFRNKKYRILVATDVVARGLDIPHIEHVINYDLPQVPEDYIHRIGRTARAGAEGNALCLISPQDGRNWHAIEMLMFPDKKHDKLPPKKSRSRNRKGGFKGKPRNKNGKNNQNGANGKNEKSNKKRFKGPKKNNNAGQSKGGNPSGGKPKSRKPKPNKAKSA